MINTVPTVPPPVDVNGKTPSVPEPAPVVPAAQPMTQQETVVIPTGYQPAPGVIVSGSANGNNNTTPAGSGKGGAPKFLIFLLVLLIIGLIGGGAWYLLGKVKGNQETTLTYWGLWENDAIIAPVISEFEAANPNIKVEYVKQSYKDYRERLSSAIDRGEGPDVFRFHNTWVAMLRNELAAVPKTVMTPEEFTNTFYPTAKNDLIGGTTIYGIPLEIDGLGLYINDDLFAAAGVVPPVTWEDVLTIAPKLTVKNDSTITTSAIALGTTTNVEHWSDILATMMMQNGAKLAIPTGKEAEEALLFFTKFSNPSDPVYTWNSNLDNSINAFAGGRVAMIIAPSWRAFDIKQINPALNFKITAIPQLPGNNVAWASYWVEGVSSKSKNKEAAWKFVQFLTSRDGATKLYTSAAKARLFGEPYARKDLSGNLNGDQYVDAYIKQAPVAVSFPLASKTHDAGLNDQMIKYLEDAVNSLSTGSSPGSALSTAATGFQQVLSRYGLVSAAAQPLQ
jgi:multiple sugar transport system substrate-binding protein